MATLTRPPQRGPRPGPPVLFDSFLVNIEQRPDIDGRPRYSVSIDRKPLGHARSPQTALRAALLAVQQTWATYQHNEGREAP